MPRRGFVACCAALVVVLAVAGASRNAGLPSAPARVPAEPSPAATPSLEAPLLALEVPPRALLVGGGAEPASTQVSIEQDLALAEAIFPEPSVLLFGSGAQAISVMEAGAENAPTLRARLAAFFGARGEPGARFRPTRLAPDGPATARHVLDVLGHALSMGDDPLLVYWAGHGDQGDDPASNAALLWGGFPITPLDLAERLDAPTTHRMLRLVLTTCYGGGFADIVFEGADPEAGPSSEVRCGLFAAPWDDEASGCDPNPDRAAQEGFGLHFLNALRGQDRDGRALPAAEVDLDGDGAVSLLEAHARARVRSEGIEVPTTTSERWLRAALEESPGPVAAPPAVDLLPEDAWVVERLGESLGLHTAAEVEAHLDALEHMVDELDAHAEEAEAGADEAYYALRIALLERWPVLDDPWHPDLDAILTRDAEAIEAMLIRSAPGRRYGVAHAREDRLARAYDTLRVKRARVLRLERAYENLGLSAELRAAADERFARYRALLACERADPFPLDGARGAGPPRAHASTGPTPLPVTPGRTPR